MTDGRPQNELVHAGESTTAAAFELVWSALTDLLGGAAAATLLRRALKLTAGRVPELRELSITKEGFEYRCTLPPSWSQPGAGGEALAELSRGLVTLLEELTGSVVLTRLQGIPQLEQYGLFRPETRR